MPGLMDILGYAGNLIDLPASSLRDLVTGSNPFDQWATPFSSDNRTSGRDMLNPIFGQNKETGMSGWLSDPMEGVADVLGFGAEMFLDPLNLVSGAGVMKALKGRKAAKATNKVVAAENAANAGKYGYVNAKLAGQADQADELVNPITQQAPKWQDKLDELEFNRLELEREYSGKAREKLGRYAGPDDYDYGQGSIFDDITSTLAIAKDPEYQQKFNQLTKQIDEIRSQNPMKRLGHTPERPRIKHGGYDWSASATPEHPYGKFDLSRIKTGEGANIRGPGAYFAQAESTSKRYRDLVNSKIRARMESPEAEAFQLMAYRALGRNAPTKSKVVDDFLTTLEKNNWLGIDVTKHNDRNKLDDMLMDRVGVPEEVLNSYDSLIAAAPKARLYELDVPDDFQEKLVDWHKPFNEQHYPVQSGLAESIPGLRELADEYADARQKGGSMKTDQRKLRGYDPNYLDTPLGKRVDAARSSAFKAQNDIAEELIRRSGLPEWDARHLLESLYNGAGNLSGEDIVKMLLRENPSTAPLSSTESVSKLGISGTQSLAGSTGRNTYNFAIWDQDLLNQMRIRAIDGEEVPINPTTLVHQVAKPRVQAADPALMQSMNPMRPIQQLPGLAAPVATTALHNFTARQNNYGGIM